MKKTLFALAPATLFMLAGCAPAPTSSDNMRDQQEQNLGNAIKSVGTPSIKNYREMRIMKDLYELRDQNGLVTYTYLKSEVDNKLCYYGETIGYGIPYATQYSASESMQRYYVKATGDGGPSYGAARLPQAEPNGLFPPAAAEGTWVMLKDPDGPDVKPVYVEPRIIVEPFKRKGVPSCWPGDGSR